MQLQISPQHQIVYEQLKWIERRRLRIRGTLIAQLGADLVLSWSGNKQDKQPNFPSSLEDLIDEREPTDFLHHLANNTLYQEAKMISDYYQFKDKFLEMENWILLGSNQAGQEAARHLLSHEPYWQTIQNWDISSLFSIVNRLAYKGLPEDNFNFSTVRPLSDASFNFQRSAFLGPWKEAKAPIELMNKVRLRWTQGILDIISSSHIYVQESALELGNSFGLESVVLKERYVSI